MDWSNLKADYERLGTFAAVAREYGVAPCTVQHRAQRMGIAKLKFSPRLPIDWSDLPELYANGMIFTQLAEHYGCSVATIQNAMKRMGVPSRPVGLPPGYEWTEQRRAAHLAATRTPEFRAKSRENLLKRLPTMRGPSANSPLERLLQAALVKAGISFQTQRTLISRYCVDILLIQKTVILEADGSLHYLREAEDAERDRNLAQAGYRVFRFNGARINRDPDGCIRQVIEACNLTPEVEPIADIRNGMVGEDNPNWRGGRRFLVCTQCGEQFQEAERNARSFEKTFCNSKCYGAWLTAHPEACNRLLRLDWSDLAQLYETMNTRQLAKHYGCSQHAVLDMMKRLGVPVRRQRQGRYTKA